MLVRSDNSTVFDDRIYDKWSKTVRLAISSFLRINFLRYRNSWIARRDRTQVVHRSNSFDERMLAEWCVTPERAEFHSTFPNSDLDG